MANECSDNGESPPVRPEMPEQWREMLETQRHNFERAASEWDSRPLMPPWLMIPELARSSMGLRMGSGETYMVYFGERYHSMSDVERQAYQTTHPEPEGWQGFYQTREDQGGR
jgi:hypothetical protein